MVYKYIVAFPILLFASQFFYMTSVCIPKVKHKREEFDTYFTIYYMFNRFNSLMLLLKASEQNIIIKLNYTVTDGPNHPVFCFI